MNITGKYRKLKNRLKKHEFLYGLVEMSIFISVGLISIPVFLFVMKALLGIVGSFTGIGGLS